MDSRYLTALIGVVASLAVSVLAWWYFDTLLFFLLIPFVPFLFRSAGSRESRPDVHRCPECGFETVDPEFEYCPRDGTRLRRR